MTQEEIDEIINESKECLETGDRLLTELKAMGEHKQFLVVTQIRTDTDHRYAKLGKYEVTVQCCCGAKTLKFISFNTDSVYHPGDTLKIGRK